MYTECLNNFASSFAPFGPNLFRWERSDEDKFNDTRVMFEYKEANMSLNPTDEIPFDEISR